MVCLLGEVHLNNGTISYEQIARNVCKKIGYDSDDKGLDYKNMSVIVNVEE